MKVDPVAVPALTTLHLSDRIPTPNVSNYVEDITDQGLTIRTLQVQHIDTGTGRQKCDVTVVAEGTQEQVLAYVRSEVG